MLRMARSSLTAVTAYGGAGHAHQAAFVARACLTAPKLVHYAQVLPPSHTEPLFRWFHDRCRVVFEGITVLTPGALSEENAPGAWDIATLPTRLAGEGLRTLKTTAPAFFVASTIATHQCVLTLAPRADWRARLESGTGDWFRRRFADDGGWDWDRALAIWFPAQVGARAPSADVDTLLHHLENLDWQRALSRQSGHAMANTLARTFNHPRDLCWFDFAPRDRDGTLLSHRAFCQQFRLRRALAVLTSDGRATDGSGRGSQANGWSTPPACHDS